MPSWLDDAVAARWADFPFDAPSRPVVLLEPRVRVEGGFVDGASKEAWTEGAITSALPVAPALLGLLPTRRGAGDGTLLTVTEVTPGTAEFRCDRGPRALRSYRLQLTGLVGSCVVLAQEVVPWWPVDEVDQASSLLFGPATVDDDGVTIHLPAFGGVLTQFHRAEFQEHASYVVGRAITSERAVPPGMAVTAQGVLRTVTGRLATPLGGRVLLSTSGQPLAVTPREGLGE